MTYLSYRHVDEDGDWVEISGHNLFAGKSDSERVNVFIGGDPRHRIGLATALMETVPAEYMQPAGEPTHVGGRKIAAIVYDDELPRVKVGEGRNLSVDNPGTGGHGYWLSDSDPDLVRRIGRSGMLASEAIARHIEARDAAKATEDREVDALVDALPLSGVVPDDYARLIAKSAYELGARPQQTEAAS